MSQNPNKSLKVISYDIILHLAVYNDLMEIGLLHGVSLCAIL